MGLSWNTLREAIAALQILGILKVRRSQRIFVLSPSYEGYFNTVINEVFNKSDNHFTLMNARIAFEPGAVDFGEQDNN